MKKFKKIVVLLVALTMLLSLVTSASAAVTSVGSFTDDRLIAEPFGADGSVTGKVEAVNTGEYRTSMTMEAVAKEEGSDDYVAKVTTSAQEGTGANYADLRNSIAKSNVENSSFSVSYDIKFESPMNFKMSVNTLNSSGASNWMINRSVFMKNSTDTSKLIIYGYSNVSIDVQKWYHVNQVFNNANGVELMTLTDEDGEVTKYTFTYNNSDVVAINRFSLTPQGAGVFYVDNIEASMEEVVITAGEGAEFNVTLPGNPISAVVVCDGVIAGEIDLEDGKNNYVVTLSDELARRGNRTVEVVASYADDSVKAGKANLTFATVNDKALVNASGVEHSMDIENFDRLGALSTVSGTAPEYSMAYDVPEKHSQWQANAGMVLISGPSGRKDDFAPSLETVNKLFQLKGISTTPVSEGYLILDFDLYLKSVSTRVQFTPLGGGYDNFITDNKLLGSINVTAGKWTHVTLKYDIANTTTYVTANGSTASVSGALDLNDGNLRFWLRAGSSVAFDNAVAYNEVDGVKKGLILSDGSEGSLEPESFDGYVDYATVLTEDTRVYTLNYAVPQNNTQWQANNTVYLVYGPSGNYNDYALAVKTTGVLIQYKGMANPAISTGKLVMEFDFLSLSDNVQINSENIGSGDANFYGANKIMGVGAVATNVWTHVMLKYDPIAKTMAITTNGNTVVKEDVTFSLAKNYARFTLKNGTGFAIDNARAYNEVTDPIVEKTEYVVSGTATETQNGFIPADASALKLTMNSAITAKADDIELYIDGSLVETSAEYADGIITVELPTLSSYSSIEVVLKNSISELTYDVVECFNVLDASGNYYKIVGSYNDGGVQRNVVLYNSSDKPSVIVAAYEGNTLTSVSTRKLASAAEGAATVVSVEVSEGNNTKVMLWNSLAGLKPVIAAE